MVGRRDLLKRGAGAAGAIALAGGAKLTLLVVAALLLSGCTLVNDVTRRSPTPTIRPAPTIQPIDSPSTVPVPLPTGQPGPMPVPTVQPAGACHIRGVLPDPVCTPGALNPDVTQANIKTTVCVKGWTSTVRPPQQYTSALKLAQMLAYGERHNPAQQSDLTPAQVEEDHFIPLSLGGAPWDAHNLWPEPGSSPNAKDKIELQAWTDVCAGRIALAQAQQEIATNWQTYSARGPLQLEDGSEPTPEPEP